MVVRFNALYLFFLLFVYLHKKLYFKIFLYIDKTTVFQFVFFVSYTIKGSCENLQQMCSVVQQINYCLNAKLAQFHENVWTIIKNI